MNKSIIIYKKDIFLFDIYNQFGNNGFVTREKLMNYSDLTKEEKDILINYMEYEQEIVENEYDNDLFLFAVCKSQDLDEDWKLAIKLGDETEENYNKLFSKVNNLVSKLDPIKR